MNYFLDALKKYATFKGRTSRKGYWMFYLLYVVFAAVMAVLDMLIGTVTVFSGIFALGTVLPALAVAVRRLHDIGKSGWYYLLCLIPIVGTILLIIWFCQEGNIGRNEYGEDPKYF